MDFFGYFENLHSGISGTVWIFPKLLHRAIDISEHLQRGYSAQLKKIHIWRKVFKKLDSCNKSCYNEARCPFFQATCLSMVFVYMWRQIQDQVLNISVNV
jgi:hypothetical protein